ncbi:ATP-binding protein [Candidatus Micrarchaeota archaeon]|nr:ATP-binding protein [Candidatus Micrarchaeota archaeon]
MALKPNPFNPRIPADPQQFIGRKAELDEFSSCLKSTMNRSPMSLATVGNRGVGKTSFSG